ncbi:MAG: hypothetical protein A2V88_01455 [Elusimicrobia bacterium RBG_16_66_12]|nr:MAG: hypothetical protein A2V88_01455 [Elusimicrobia bacterium RBG_16_66_12]
MSAPVHEPGGVIKGERPRYERIHLTREIRVDEISPGLVEIVEKRPLGKGLERIQVVRGLKLDGRGAVGCGSGQSILLGHISNPGDILPRDVPTELRRAVDNRLFEPKTELSGTLRPGQAVQECIGDIGNLLEFKYGESLVRPNEAG